MDSWWQRVALVAAICLTMPLAGCLGDDEASVPPAAGTGADEAGAEPGPGSVDAWTGTLTGRVVNASLSPVPDAAVLVSGPNVTHDLTTDDNGTFVLTQLPVGAYEVRAGALGHEPAVTRIEVGATNVTAVELILAEARDTTPFTVALEWEGLMGLGAAAAVADGFSYTNGAADENHDTVHEFALEARSLETILVRMRWEDPLANLFFDLWKDPDCSASCVPAHDYGQGEPVGDSDLLLRLDRPQNGWPKLDPDNDTLWLFVWPAADDDQPASVAYQVPFRVDVALFHHEGAPDGFLPGTDGPSGGV